MSAALHWLRQQRSPGRGASGSPLPEAPQQADEWQDVVATLRRLRERGPRRMVAARAAAPDRALPGHEIAPGLWQHRQHRAWPVAPNALDLSGLWGTRHPSRRGIVPIVGNGPIDPRRLLFFDTETTGLAGGTGTRAFMVGLARFESDGLTITQYTTATMAAEPAMLEALLADLGDAPILVSYNGRSYDRPLLSARLRLARRTDPLPDLPHLDLLHPTRRRWRTAWPNCRLATVERQWLGIVRDHDLPGSEAPAAWLTYLRGGSAALLRRVGEHNAQDLVSLAALLLKHLD